MLSLTETSQSSAISLGVQAVNTKELEVEIACMCASWYSFLTEATAVATSMGIKSQLEMRQRKRKHFFDESKKQRTEEQSPETLFRVEVFHVAMDNIISQLHVRFSSVQQICDEFCVLWKFRDMLQDSISASCAKLSEKYKNNLTESFEDQIQRLKKIYSATFEDGLGLLDLLNAIYTVGLQSIYGDWGLAMLPIERQLAKKL